MAGADIVYKIVTGQQWDEARQAGLFKGAPVDLEDGFIHFSTAEQVLETAAKHFKGQDGLLLVAVEVAALGDALVFEPSRGGKLFPHLYADLPLSAVRSVDAFPLGADGRHHFKVVAANPSGRSGGPTRR